MSSHYWQARFRDRPGVMACVYGTRYEAVERLVSACAEKWPSEAAYLRCRYLNRNTRRVLHATEIDVKKVTG